MQVLRGKVLFVNTVQSGATNTVYVPGGYSEHEACEPEGS